MTRWPERTHPGWGQPTRRVYVTRTVPKTAAKALEEKIRADPWLLPYSGVFHDDLYTVTLIDTR